MGGPAHRAVHGAGLPKNARAAEGADQDAGRPRDWVPVCARQARGVRGDGRVELAATVPQEGRGESGAEERRKHRGLRPVRQAVSSAQGQRALRTLASTSYAVKDSWWLLSSTPLCALVRVFAIMIKRCARPVVGVAAATK